MIRVTTNNTLRLYQTNLNKSANQLYSAMGKLMTGRNFDSYAADPAGATRAFKIHSALNATNAQAANNETVVNKFSTAYSVLDGVVDKISQEMGNIPSLEGLNGTNANNLHTFAQILDEGADAIVQLLNSKYSNDYIFNGAETKEAPFAIATDQDGKDVLTFRGWRVDVPNNDEDYITPNGMKLDENGNEVDPNATNVTFKKNSDVYKQLQDMANETLWVDIGLGFEVENGQVVEDTAFNSALSGMDLLGFGLDGERGEDGDPNNIVSLMLELADVFEGYDIENLEGGPDGDYDDAVRLVDKFQDANSELTDKWSELSARVTYLNSNQERLTRTFDNLDTERGSIEDVDQVDAIMELFWAQTTYNAALQVGANVIPQSLMDYLQ